MNARRRLLAVLMVYLVAGSGNICFGQDAITSARIAQIEERARQANQITDGLIPVLFRLADGEVDDSKTRSLTSAARVRAAGDQPSRLEAVFAEVLGEGATRSSGVRASAQAPARIADLTVARVLEVAAARLTKDELNRLIASGRFEIDNDPVVQIPPNEIPRIRGATPSAATAGNVTKAIEWIKVPEVWNKGFTGTDTIVAVLDTGVARVAGLQGRLLSGFNTISGGTNTQDVQGHGTHVAGTVAGSQDSGVGVAPSARILPIKVLDDQGFGTLSSIISGIVKALENGADVINISIEIRVPLQGIQLDSWLKVIATAKAGNVPVALAAGNQGQLGIQSGLAVAKDAIVVGAVNLSGSPAPFTGRGGNSSKPDLSAPGVDIVSFDIQGRGVAMNGTSMATPHIAGVLALLRQTYPDEGVDQLRKRLVDNAVGPAQPGVTGAGVVDAAAALGTPGSNGDDDGTEGENQVPVKDRRLTQFIDTEEQHRKVVDDLKSRSDYWIKKYKDAGRPLVLE